MYDIGDRVSLSAAFTDEDGTPVIPSGVICEVQPPSGSTQNLAVSGTAGTYTAELEPDESGRWWYRFAGTGTYTAAEEGHFYIRRRRVA